MRKVSFPVIAITFFVGGLLFVYLSPTAKSQIQVMPAYVPIGAAASGTTSMAWFHNPSLGTVMACQASSSSGASISGIQCVATKLQ